MVCKECRAAGAMTNRGRDQIAKDRKDLARDSFAASEALHDECRGHCDCQHWIPPVEGVNV